MKALVITCMIMTTLVLSVVFPRFGLVLASVLIFLVVFGIIYAAVESIIS